MGDFTLASVDGYMYTQTRSILCQYLEVVADYTKNYPRSNVMITPLPKSYLVAMQEFIELGQTKDCISLLYTAISLGARGKLYTNLHNYARFRVKEEEIPIIMGRTYSLVELVIKLEHKTTIAQEILE